MKVHLKDSGDTVTIVVDGIDIAEYYPEDGEVLVEVGGPEFESAIRSALQARYPDRKVSIQYFGIDYT